MIQFGHILICKKIVNFMTEEMKLTPEQYFPYLYLQDLERWAVNSDFPSNVSQLKSPRPPLAPIGSICGKPSRHQFFESGAYKDFHSFTHFICVTYELNLLNFAIHEYSQGGALGLFNEWKANAAPFLETHGYEHTSGVRISSDELIRFFCEGEPTKLDGLFPARYFERIREFAPSAELLKVCDEFFVPKYAEEVCGSPYALMEFDNELKASKLDRSLDFKALVPVAKRNFGEQLLQSILRDPDCSSFRARNLERLKLTEIEQMHLEQLTKEGIADPLSELIQRRSKIAQCRNQECQRVFSKTRKGQHFCSFECRDAYYHKPDVDGIQMVNELYAEMTDQLEKELAEAKKTS